MSTKTPTITATSRVTWCLTTNGYADEATCHDPERGITKPDHDHYDVALTEDGKVAWRYWPVGTTFKTADGYTMRLRKYEREFADMIAMEDAGMEANDAPARPHWDGVAPSGGAFGEAHWVPSPEDTIIIYALDEDVRPAPMALFVLPNGEAWRLRNYSVDWTAEPFTGDNVRASWTVLRPGGMSSTADGDLPSGARLVWHP